MARQGTLLAATGVALSVGTLLVVLGAKEARAASTRRFRDEQYPPYAPKTVELFRAAARHAGFPLSWASERGLHVIIDGESNGWVGLPNYTYDSVFGVDIEDPDNRHLWPQVWQQLRAGRIMARSSATGIGQLLSSNVDRYYPSKREGLGDAFEEAVGMLRYIHARYGDPRIAGRHKEQPDCTDEYLATHRVRYNRDAVLVHGCSAGEGY